MADAPDPAMPPLDAEALKARRRRNLWLGLSLATFVILVMAMTVIRLNTAIGVSERM